VKSGSWLIIVVLGAIVAGVLIYFMAGGSPNGAAVKSATTRPAVRLASRPATRPTLQRVVAMEMLMSPGKAQGGADAAVNKLIGRHNQLEDQLRNVVLKGTCTWAVDGPPGNPAPMTMTYDRTQDAADLQCGPRHCTVKDGKVTMDFDSWMNMDALYLMVFRKFDPAMFKPAEEPAKDGEIAVESANERLTFDADSGRLVQMEYKTPASGTIVTHFGDFVPMSADGAIELPGTIAVTIPKKVYPSAIKDESGMATFNLEPSQSRVGEQQ
jgi:hypothetical protein